MTAGRGLDGRPWHATGTAILVNRGDGTGIAHGPALGARPRVLTAVLQHAALAMQMTRLRAALAATLAEVTASRERIVAAGERERRRLERDLHDGAQQQLVSLGVTLRLLQQSLPEAARLLEPQLDRAVGEIESVIGELRRIAAGVRPARLDEGLLPALTDLARGTAIPVAVAAGPGIDVDGTLAAAAYFVACEAVTNAIRHSGASAIRIDLRRDALTLAICVTDDGVGGAEPQRGSGLTSLADRVAGQGGTLLVDSPAGRDTRVEAILPCAS